ncbi:ComEA family DNA-binding protein [Colwelliaceae bacterium 6441]
MKNLFICITIFLATITSLTSLAFSDKQSMKKALIAETANQQVLVININQADPKELLALKGIGKKKAQAIINYRQENGDFKSINDLLKVQGIGQHVIEENKNRLKI